MAGAKETPRQKMIGLMYLVLMAMLALNVSSAVLDKFIFLNDSLESSVKQTKDINSNTVQRIQSAVEEAGSREKDMAVLDKAKKVRELAAGAIEYTESIKKEIIDATGGYDADGDLKGKKDTEKMANLMINKGKGEELKSNLNKFVADLESLTGMDFEDIAFDGKDHPTFKDVEEHAKKDFATLNFDQSPTVAGLATITQFQTEVMSRANRALEALAQQVGAGDLKFDLVSVRVVPKSSIVAAGAVYEADLFLAASSSAGNASMYVDGNEIPVEGSNGKVKFRAKPGNYDKKTGLARKTYIGKIEMNDSAFVDTIEYFVAQPVIQVTAQAVQALYLQCGNELDVQVPALGAEYNPQFSARGGTAIAGNKPGLVTVVPTAAEVTLSVSSGGDAIGSRTFKVKRVPKPEIVAKSRGRAVNLKQGVPAPGPTSLELDAIADEDFRAMLPKDARYRVSEWRITLARGSRPVDQQVVRGSNASLSGIAQKARAGDRLVIEVTKVQRMNFRNAVLDVPMGSGSSIITIPIN
ncbi:type IX secretion system motor protein PorM/GldM [Marinigracilibium pacificum]|uniref:Gliding motility protein GldM n=1 Tax=Marinigracilibium pacificum TaxID=2729599 RepID=A0A848IV91_9BACT|nr:gliding motility protein GldM [Marinigracilibium pacificum]NMM47151.1 gliding motility protein GldM [Marinigracilibium pacificum]